MQISKTIIQQTYKTNRQDKDGTRKKERTYLLSEIRFSLY